MRRKKICLLGAAGSGKTSLVRRFVQGTFNPESQSQVGVRVDRKIVHVGGEETHLLIWDVHGEDEEGRMQEFCLRDVSGYILVADAARQQTLDEAQRIQSQVAATTGDLPLMLVLAKCDLLNEQIAPPPQAEEELTAKGWEIVRTSAKTVMGVEEAFTRLVAQMLERNKKQTVSGGK